MNLLRPYAFLPVLVLALALLAGGERAVAAHRVETAPGAAVSIEIIEYLESAPPSGWIPAAIRIANRAPEARSWEVTLTGESGVNRNLLGIWPLHVPGGETRTFDVFIPQPWFPSGSNYVELRATLTGPGVSGPPVMLNRSFFGTNQTRFTAMSHRLAAENWSRLQAELAPQTATVTSPTATRLDLSGCQVDPVALPADWRSWSGFATAWLHRDDWLALSGAQRVALLRWVAQGGELYVAGAAGGRGLDDLPQAGARELAGTSYSRSDYGFGFVHRVPLADGPANDGPRLAIEEMAFVLRNPSATSPSLAHLTSVIDTTEAEHAVGQIRPGGLVLGLVIAGIALLLGPVNIFVLAPARRRARLFITVPLISLGGAMALVILILLQDGTGGRGQRGVLLHLLPDRPEALVLQEQCSLTGLLLARSFAVPEDVTLIDYTDTDEGYPYAPMDRPPRDGLNRVGSHASGAWFNSRTVHAQHLRAFLPTRASLTLHVAGPEELAVLSTCPGVLRDVVVTAADGTPWWAREVPPGREVALSPADPELRETWQERLTHHGVSLGTASARPDTPLTFHAVADGWDETVPVPTLPSIRWRNDTILVTGMVKEARP